MFSNRQKLLWREQKVKEEKALREALYDEIIWALRMKKDIAEQSGSYEEVKSYESLIRIEEDKKDGTFDKRLKEEEMRRKEQKKLDELAKERKRLADIVQEADLKRAEQESVKKSEEKRKLELERIRLDEEKDYREEEESFNRLPKWKKEMISGMKEKEHRKEAELEFAEEKVVKLLEEQQNLEVRNQLQSDMVIKSDKEEKLPKLEKKKKFERKLKRDIRD